MTRPGGHWQNWSRSASVKPQRVEFPRTPEAVQRAVLAAKARNMQLKAVGAGHSFTGIAIAPGVQLDLTDLSGLVSVDEARQQVTLLAGTRLHQIPGILAPYGLAMPNLGDIDRQSISGAISTGTHGTGLAFGGISTQVVGVTVVSADGEFVRIDEHNQPELLSAYALSLGALGVLVDVTLQCVPAFVLQAKEQPEPIDAVLDDLVARMQQEDHFEFYWFPHTDVAMTKTNTRLPESAPRHPLSPAGKWVEETFLSNGIYRVVCAAGRVVPAIAPPFNRLAVRVSGAREYTDISTKVFTQSRTVRFREMEYAVPLEKLADVVREIRELVAARGWKITFPVEVRAAAADELWLSTAHGRVSGYIAVHRYWREDPTEYFSAVEAIATAAGGRPHWGKMHTLDDSALRERYPRFDEFVALRDTVDPQRMFRNRYLDRVLGA